MKTLSVQKPTGDSKAVLFNKVVLEKIYKRLYNEFGPQNWWPARTRLEVIVGAVLTQNTNWGNVEKALDNLRKEGQLSLGALKNISHEKLASCIRPAGYFNVKAKRLKNVINFLFDEFGGDFSKVKREDWILLRQKFLNVNGVGPETADSILLYAFDKPVFVIDAYTKRILSRHNIINKTADYHVTQKIFMDCLEHNVVMFNEYHALIVRLAKDYCKVMPLCDKCPLQELLLKGNKNKAALQPD